uniref:transposase-like zinc-binding domain-containing protein n=1 Tax=Klebsiella sp. TaxID=576 RepID=UPI002585D0FD|nr:cytoplasmic protein [Klebsiella sp.]
MFNDVNVDSCKTPGCKNMGVLNSPDYICQGNNILCRECGFLFPPISAKSLNAFRRTVNQGWKGLIKQCPGCGSFSLKRYGYSAQGERRISCRDCGKTLVIPDKAKISLRQEHLAALIKEGSSLSDIRTLLAIDNTTLGRELANLSYRAGLVERGFAFPTFDIVLSTRAFSISFNGGDNRLYVLATAEEVSGKVVAISTNYTSQPVEAEYQYQSQYEERMPPGTLAHLVQRKEMLTMRRRVALFDIDYGPAALHRHERGMLVKPVLPAYRHFELVRMLTDERSLNVQHYLDHECFILGGCMMANLEHVRQGRCHISFVRERGIPPAQRDIPPRLFYSGGIRNNVWRTFSTRDYAMAVCNLTGNKKTSPLRNASLRSASEFIQYIHQHPFLPWLNRMSPANVTAALNHLKYEYNNLHL